MLTIHSTCIVVETEYIMDFSTKLAAAWKSNNSLLSVGLDPDLEKLPAIIKQRSDPIVFFNRAIIKSTAPYVCAFKLNTAFYEALGSNGIEQLKATTDYIKQNYPDIPIIIDAKRADIGNTNVGSAAYVFDYLQGDAVTLNPYMGQDALLPFLEREDKCSMILCRTSNRGAGEFQDLIIDGKPLFAIVAEKVKNSWNKNNNCSVVVGATYPKELKVVRQIIGDTMIILMPGLGFQGADAKEAVLSALNANGDGIIINASRDVIYAANDDMFAEAARQKAMSLRDEINNSRRK